ncbi:hypothetical protein ACFU53_25405 [Streptomyces sp. NPDC057474]|uniref:hypothetical protein n=1 Tax=Streptomyces sp. NPDC057474 TaxID=3346144 RepID=UPI0036C86C17
MSQVDTGKDDAGIDDAGIDDAGIDETSEVETSEDGEAAVVRLPMLSDGPLDPPAAWERLRARCPVATVELPSGDRAKFVSRWPRAEGGPGRGRA